MWPSYLHRLKYHYAEGSELGTEECEVCYDDDTFKGSWWTYCEWYEDWPEQCGQQDTTRYDYWNDIEVPMNATTQCCACRDVERYVSLRVRIWNWL